MKATLCLAWLLGGVACAEAFDEPAPSSAPHAAAAALVQVTSFGANPGALRMFYYAPPGLPAGAPLVVAMHGCTQSAAGYAGQTDWALLGERYRFAVVFPEQPGANNAQSCFNWFLPEDTTRGQGEALSIKQMVDEMKARFGSDPARIFATGMSAGGFMTEVMLATYPDVFAGGAVNAGGAYRCANSLSSGFSCMQGSVQRTPAQWGELVRAALPGYPGPYPRVVAFHGASDATVAPAALAQTVDQWTNVAGIDNTADETATFRTATRKRYRDGAGALRLETYLLAQTGHALSVDPGTGVDQGGATGAFAEDRDLFSSYYAASFWGLLSSGDGGGDRSPPTVSLTAPADGAVVSGTVSVTATASDDTAVTRVEVLVDGAVVGTDSSAPYAVAVATDGLASGAHVLTARAFDAAGNQGGSAARTITVSNGGGGVRLETFSSASGPDQVGWVLGGLALDASKDATGSTGSRSLAGAAAPAFGTITLTASWSGLALGAAPRLTYARQLSLANANVTARSAVRVVIDDGVEHVVDEVAAVGLQTLRETAWTRRTVELAPYAGKVVTLRLVVTATDLSSTVTRAEAWFDQLELR